MSPFPSLDDPVRIRAFIERATAPARAPLVPEFTLRLATEITPIWEMTEAELAASGLPPPFWAFCWPGGQALARFLLDNPETARGKRVLSFACGGGVEALAAAQAGAAATWANDIDPVALEAAGLNAAANGLALQAIGRDLLAEDAPSEGPFDLILAGDVFYERPIATRMEAWLRARAAEGAVALVGDPGRTFLPQTGMTALAIYDAPTPRELEDREIMRTTVWRVAPA
jgi:predicted nicotinamide N-methyase